MTKEEAILKLKEAANLGEEEQTEYIKAIINTFQFEHANGNYHICPKCRKYMIIPGYVCYGCGHDDSFD